MFRLLSTNAQLTFRPVLLLQVRSNKGSLSFPSASSAVQVNNNNNNSNNSPSNNNSNNGFVAATPMFTRSNSLSATAGVATGSKPGYSTHPNPGYGSGRFNDHSSRDISSTDANYNLRRFQDTIRSANSQRNNRDNRSKVEFAKLMTRLIESFEDPTLRASCAAPDLFRYSQILSFSIYHNRTNRLSGSKNRDSDQYHSENLHDELFLKGGVLKFADYVLNGEFNNILQARTLQFLFYSLSQLRANQELIALWEQGAMDKSMGSLFLEPKILAIILPVSHELGRFTYEEVLELYQQCCEKNDFVGHELLSSVGKIAIIAGDYSKGLDALEALLKLYESSSQEPAKVLGALSDLHLCFIGSCKDIKIAKHFFDKVVAQDLPYRVRLKVPHVESLLKNSFELNEPFDNTLYFWKATIAHYNNEEFVHVLNSRYSILNNTLFTIFFKTYPTLNAESYEKLKEIIATYADLKPVDEFFLNTIISNYTWGEKVVLEQLVDSYAIYNVERTPVSYRICLKKTGEIQNYTNAEILAKWNESLVNLDNAGISYIPIADWAALRDATILSPFTNERKGFYLTVLDAYKDYIQDSRTLSRFLTHWSKKIEHIDDIKRLTTESNPQFDTDVEVLVPQFVNLRKNIDYKSASRSFRM